MASADQRVAELRLRFKTEKQSLEATKRDLNSFQQSFSSFKTESEKSNRALEQQVRILQAEKAAALDSRKAINDFAKEQRAAANEADKTTKAIKLQNAELKNQPTATGGRSAGAQALQAFGREARLSVPAIPIPGTNLSSEVFFRVAEISGRLGAELKTLAISGGLATGAIIAVKLAFEKFVTPALKIAETFNSIFQAQVDVAGLLASNDAQAIVDRRKQLLDQLNQKEAERNTAIEKSVAASESLRGQGLLGQIILGGTQALSGGPKGSFIAQLDNDIAGIQTQLDALNPVVQQYIDQLEAERILKQQEANLDNLRAAELSALQGSPDALNARIKALEQERALVERDLNTYAISDAKHAEYLDRVDLINATIERLNGTVRTQVEETERLAKAEQYLKDQRKEASDTVKKFNEDINRLNEQRTQQEAAIYQRNADRIIQITEQAADAAEKALQTLNNRRDDLGVDLQRDFRDDQRKAEFERLSDQIKAQEEESKSYRDHLRSLRQIREDSQAQEFDLVLNRDFAGLRRLRQDTARRLQDESRTFTEQRSERQLALVQQAQDDQRQREFERENRLIRYRDALADADLQARRELQQIEVNKRRELQRLAIAANQELTLLNQKYVAELTGRRNAVQAELSIISQGYSARLQQDANYVNALLAQGRLLQAGGLFGLFGTAAAPLVSNSNRSAVNTNNFNISTGANPAQQQSLVTLIENVVARSFARIAQ